MNEREMLDLMLRFRTAYGRGDQEGLLAVTSTDFEWHQHYANTSAELPNGRTMSGIGPLMDELAWRKSHWSDVSYTQLEERAASDDLLVQTFVIQGLENDKPFHAKVVDLYPVSGGKITRKDTYWKYLK